jgi:hypothetical protein
MFKTGLEAGKRWPSRLVATAAEKPQDGHLGGPNLTYSKTNAILRVTP